MLQGDGQRGGEPASGVGGQVASDREHFASSGDPVRSMELLWGSREAPRRGPKPGLSVERIVRAAIEVADGEGLAALSMRRVAERLGVGAMSLYTYVPGKAELIDVMLDTAIGDARRPDADADEVGGGWRAKLEAVARGNWALFHRHPWLLQVVAVSRPPLGPNVIAKYDDELRAVDGIGLSEAEMDSVVGLVTGHAEAAARRAIEADRAVGRSGLSDEEWWRAYEPLLTRVFDRERFPTAARVGGAAGGAFDAGQAFEFGLQRLLDGIEVLVATRAAERG